KKVINLGSNELLNLVGSSQLDDRNYLQWSHYFRTCLKGCKKLGHIEGGGPLKDDPPKTLLLAMILKGLLFKKEGTLYTEIYTSTNYVGLVVDRRSISGFCIFLGRNLITWRSKKQNVVARSSGKAKFRTMTLMIM
ncbi:putative mitochondrial protein, partial [Mucuna pruriens]